MQLNRAHITYHFRNIYPFVVLFVIFGCISCAPFAGTVQPTVTPVPTPTPQAVILVKPAGSVPAACTPTPVYFGVNGGLAIPWVAATPASSGIVAHLFFSQLTPSNKPAYYEPMYANGKMPDGGSTKILWRINNASAIGEITITGKNLFRPGNTFRQTFVAASSGIPSIVDVPTAGCWRFDLQSGSDQGTAIFWVLP
jgi:hypothetical protein